MTQAFFSYARIDWNAPANSADVQGLVNGLEPQVQAELGDKSFSVWRDDALRWGDRWRDKLNEVIGRSDFFIVLLSIGCLRSDVCGWEYDAFHDRAKRDGLESRILPILLREIDKGDLQELTPEQHTRYTELRKIQQTSWRDLPQLNERDLNRLLDQTAKALKSSVRSLPPKAPEPTVQPKPTNTSPHTAPVDGHIIPPVSGNYDIPSQPGDIVTLDLTVAGFFSVETKEGTVVFAITNMIVQTTLKGGRIRNANPKFAAGWQGPVATVTRIQAGTRQTALQIQARDEYLWGEPLIGKGDFGHEFLFDLEPEEGKALEVSGTVSIQGEAVRIDDDKCDLDGSQKEARDVMIARLTKILLKDHIKPNIELEGATDDRTDSA